jgi:hypothetical protein
MRFEAKSIDPSLISDTESGEYDVISDNIIIPVIDYGAREDNSFLVALRNLVQVYLSSKDIAASHSIADKVQQNVCDALGINIEDHNAWSERAKDEARRAQGQLQSAILRDGPRFWTELHLFSLRNRNCPDVNFIKNWFDNWVDSIPWNGCPCKEHFEDYCKSIPPNFSDLWKWGIEIHNDVNMRIGKKQLSFSEAEKLWIKRLL